MEITRRDILNRLVDHFGYESYLEIGVSSGSLFKRIRVRNKTGVDPAWRWWYMFHPGIHRMTSDAFFAANEKRFDLVFVDGLHEAEQAYRDIQNALAVLNPGGTILVHDCLPISKEQQLVPRVQKSWTGDAWRAFVKTSLDPALTTILFDTNRGCGLIRPLPRPANAPVPPADPDPLDPRCTWEAFDAHKTEWLRIVPGEQVFSLIDGLSPAGIEPRTPARAESAAAASASAVSERS